MRLAQRVGADDAHAVRMHVAQSAGRNAPGTASARCVTVLVEPALIVQAVGKAHHFAQAIEDGELAVRIARDDHVEAVRTRDRQPR